MSTQSVRVFVSSTYWDLREYRDAVREALEQMRVKDSSMEVFGASDHEPTALSLDELEKCNVYVGIIGHRYGSLTPDGAHSITEAEYLFAHQQWRAGKMRILPYLADGSVGLAGDLLESEDRQERQRAFRELLVKNHTPQRFNKPNQLAVFIAADLYKLREAGLPDGGGPKIFDQDEWPGIEAEFDATEDRVKKIQAFLEFVTKSFASLFHIDPLRFEVHPFIRQVNKELNDAIPGVSLDAKDGTLVRSGVHHIMLRADTAVTLMNNISPERLQTVAEEIGRSAAKDLIDNRVRPRENWSGERPDPLIPASAEALVKMWAYWDRTGGWGKIQLLKPSPRAPGEVKPADPRWRLKIENNFLGREKTPARMANSLAGFWCGYIKGFLNYALPAIQEVMQHLPQDRRARVRLPAYNRVSSVDHLPDNSPLEDTFIVTFQKQPLSDARRALGKAHDARKAAKKALDTEHAKTHYEDMVAECRFAVISARHEMGQRFDEEFVRIEFPNGGREVIERIVGKADPPEMDDQVAKAWFDACNHLVQRLSDAIGGNS